MESKKLDESEISENKQESCSHSLRIGSLCAICGKESLKEADVVAAAHNTDKLVQTKDEAKKLQKIKNEQLLKKGKMILILDLDQTVLHTTIQKVECDFTFILFSTVFYVKLRPHLTKFLDKINKIFEIHVYTMGTREYAKNICKYIDPIGKYFGDRIVSRSENFNELKKTIDRITPIYDNVVIIDDRADVWDYSKNTILIKPYWFADNVDINDPSGSSFYITEETSKDRPNDRDNKVIEEKLEDSKLIKTKIRNEGDDLEINTDTEDIEAHPRSKIFKTNESVECLSEAHSDTDSECKEDKNDENRQIRAESPEIFCEITSGTTNHDEVWPENGEKSGFNKSRSTFTKMAPDNMSKGSFEENSSLDNVVDKPGDCDKSTSHSTNVHSKIGYKDEFLMNSTFSDSNENNTDQPPSKMQVSTKTSNEIIKKLSQPSNLDKISPKTINSPVEDIELLRILKNLKKLHKKYFQTKKPVDELLRIKSMKKIRVCTSSNYFGLVVLSGSVLDFVSPSIAVESDELARKHGIINVSSKWLFECIYNRKAIPTLKYLISDHRPLDNIEYQLNNEFFGEA